MVMLEINQMKNILIKNSLNEDEEELIKDRVYLFIKKKISQIWDDNNTDKYEKLTFFIYFFLLHWHNVFVWSKFDFDGVKNWIKEYEEKLKDFKGKEITDFEEKDTDIIVKMYDELLRSLIIEKKQKNQKKQYTGASKTLHILAPKFFPLWDDSIRKKFGFKKGDGKEYVEFIKRIKEFLSNKKDEIDQLKREYDNTYGFQKDDKSIVKILDEYLFLKYSKSKRQ